MNMNPILIIVSSEFSSALRQPVLVVISILLFTIAIFCGAGSSLQISHSSTDDLSWDDPFFLAVMSSSAMLAPILSAFAMFIGVLAMSDEKSDGTIRVLITKPLYWKDIIIGKLLGLSAFLIMLTVFSILLFVSAVMVFYGGPQSVSELILRTASYIMALCLLNILMLAISMLLGTIIDNTLVVLTITGLLYWLQSYAGLAYSNIMNYVLPLGVYGMILSGNGNFLYQTSVPYGVWLSGALPLIVLESAVILSLFLANCYLFSRYES